MQEVRLIAHDLIQGPTFGHNGSSEPLTKNMGIIGGHKRSLLEDIDTISA